MLCRCRAGGGKVIVCRERERGRSWVSATSSEVEKEMHLFVTQVRHGEAR